jgi:SNF2 family DNA or RNA helicase
VTIAAWRDRDRLIVRAPYGVGVRLREVPTGRWDRALSAWSFAASRVVARKLLPITGALDAVAALAGEQPAPPREDAIALPDGGVPRWRHQTRGAWWLADRDAALLQYGMGTGKTRIALDALRLVDARLALVVCPLSVVPVWRAQAARWCPHPEATVLDLDAGGVARKARTMRGFLLPPRAARLVVAVVNYESAWRPALGEAILEREWDAVIYDECHRIKSPSSSASMFAAKLRPKVRRRWALSGTPLAHSPMDAYAIFRALDPGVFGTSFARFRAEYAVMGGFQGKQVLGYRNLDGFRESYYTLALAQDRDVLDLPPTHHVELTVALEPATRRLYEQLRTEFVAELGGGTVTAAHALTRMLRLQQLTGGALDSDEGLPLHRSEEKERALADFLIDLDPAEPVVVFARFRADLAAVRRAARHAGRRVRELSGSARELSEWQADGDGSVLATQIQSGGEGIDLTRAAHCVYYSLGFSLAQYEQSLARTHRPGQTRPVTYYHLIASSSIDRYVYRTLRQRRDVINRVLEEGLTDEG